MFTDAAAEFSDSGVSPGLDERLESVSDKSVEKGVVDELNSNQLMKSDETASKHFIIWSWHPLLFHCKLTSDD